MPFDPKTLPSAVYAEFKKGPKFWPLVVKAAIEVQIFDITKLTDIVFYQHHPERIGNPLKPFETKLIDEWKAFRLTIAPWANREERAYRLLNPPAYTPYSGIEGTDVQSF